MKSFASFMLALSISLAISGQSLNTYGRKMALVIGNGNYKNSILANPENDARSIRNILEKLDFKVFSF